MLIKLLIFAVLIFIVIYCTWALMRTKADNEIIEERLFQEYVNKKNQDENMQNNNENMQNNNEKVQNNHDCEHILPNKSNILSGLEWETVEKLKTEFSTLYTVNKDSDITIGECEDNYLAFGQRYILLNGKVIGFEV